METRNVDFDSLTAQVRPPLPLVLAVDDNIDHLLLLSYIVEDLPCLFLSETNGKDALETIARLNPALVLLDVRLPGLSGFDIIQQLKSSLDTVSIPVVAVTALAGQHYKQQLLGVGFDHHIGKPYQLTEIQAVIQQYL
jgi:CheY-like chemotaxis protein